MALMAFSLNQNGALCLPLVSDDQRLIWVRSSEINLRLDGAAELDKAFDKFPYLTENQTAALAERCSLHPDQVKVWFMGQRLRYGISWDYEDINNVRRKFKLNWGKEELQNWMKEKDRGEVKQPAGKKVEKVLEEESAPEGGMMGENEMANEQSETKPKLEQPGKKDKDKREDEDKGKTQSKRKKVTASDEMEMKRKKRRDEGDVERAGSEEFERKKSTGERKRTEEKKKLLTIQERPAHTSVLMPDESLGGSPLLVFLSQSQDSEQLKREDAVPTSTSGTLETGTEAKLEGHVHAESNHNGAVTDFNQLEELMEMLDISLVADESLGVTQQPGSRAAEASTPPARTRLSTKTQAQLAMMKAAFSHCQYPNAEDYSRLAKIINIPRHTLVQWFGDMRYYVKKVKPRWMTEEQHSKALANVRYQQHLKALVKTKLRVASSEGAEKPAWQTLLEMSENC
ncbi:zinc fingers and homeoboxes protein 3-like [Plectropomus leopardus]|uniref:zinc fingers and homeoboxes protein 3-like n=1 Tax=Plectropomus leopardus TaxID=160734 RepID=UPI001C4B9FB7|nr:zinc fingers and homeoboxes protein 3-like [Plectropomus leopardus]